MALPCNQTSSFSLEKHMNIPYSEINKESKQPHVSSGQMRFCYQHIDKFMFSKFIILFAMAQSWKKKEKKIISQKVLFDHVFFIKWEANHNQMIRIFLINLLSRQKSKDLRDLGISSDSNQLKPPSIDGLNVLENHEVCGKNP